MEYIISSSSPYNPCFFIMLSIIGLSSDCSIKKSLNETDTHFLAIFDRQRMAEALETTHKPKDVDCQDRVALIFEVKDVDATYNHLKKQGLKFVTKPTDRPAWGLRTSHLRDPDGNLIELYTNHPDIYIP